MRVRSHPFCHLPAFNTPSVKRKPSTPATIPTADQPRCRDTSTSLVEVQPSRTEIRRSSIDYLMTRTTDVSARSGCHCLLVVMPLPRVTARVGEMRRNWQRTTRWVAQDATKTTRVCAGIGGSTSGCDWQNIRGWRGSVVCR